MQNVLCNACKKGDFFNINRVNPEEITIWEKLKRLRILCSFNQMRLTSQVLLT